jgi:hypothetical protein
MINFNGKKRPRLLLHTCCGVCGAWVPEMLSGEYLVTIFYFNPNIFPKDEYNRRQEAARLVAKKIEIEFIEGEYDHGKWLEAIRGLEQEPEGGKRCLICFDYRLSETARYAKKHGFDFFASTLTIGRNKRADIINPIGEKWAKKLGIKFLAEDWKKQGGQVETEKKSKEMDIYRQNYCGCEFSMRKD